MNPYLLSRQTRAHLIQPAAQRAIVNRVSDPHHRAAQQRRIERVLRFNFLARKSRQHCRQLFFLFGAQLHCRRDLRLLDALPLPDHLIKRVNNFRKQLRTPVVRNHKQKIANDLARTQPRHDSLDNGVLVFDGDRRARQKRAQFRRLPGPFPKVAELLARWLSPALRRRDIRQGICILEARGLQFGLPSRLFTKLLIRDSCACGVSCLASSVSAPSTARFAASAFSSSRAARSAASISAFAAAALFCRSLCVAARSRVTSAAGSRSAQAAT